MIGGWRTALRVARRDAQRHRGATLLALALITLPVLAVSTAAVLFMTERVDPGEAPERRMGAAAALIEIDDKAPQVAQAPDPREGSMWMGEEPINDTSLGDVERVLGADREYVTVAEGEIEFATADGWARVSATEVDLASPLVDGMVRHVEGEAVPAAGEVVVNQALADRGVGMGDDLELRRRGADESTTLRVVGITESARFRDMPMAFAAPGAFDLRQEGPRRYLVGGGPVTWDHVLELNQLGVLVTSRAVLADPPSPEELPMAYQGLSQGGNDDAVLAVAGLVAVMVLIEVVLLAGPSFAVGARRQAHTLAIMGANGGTTRQLRRTVLASGVVLGGLGAAVGVVGGIALGWVLQPVLQRFSSSWFGPFDVPWLILLGVAGFGVLSALLAAIVPAFIASRRNVVDVLAGRRGDGRPSRGAPVLGVIVLGVGVTLAVMGTRPTVGSVLGMRENLIAVSAIVCVLGMVLLIPVVVVLAGRLVARAPLPIRFAGRDAARHRSRTVPAVAAVAATVAGVVALGIATASDEAQARGNYQASRPMGAGIITDWDAESEPDWAAYRAAVEEHAPDVEVTAVRGVPQGEFGPDLVIGEGDGDGFWVETRTCCGVPVLVGDQVPAGVPGVDADDRAAADDVLAAGGAVVYTSGEEDVDVVDLRAVRWTEEGPPEELGRVDAVPVHLVDMKGADGVVTPAPARAVLSPGLVERLGLEADTVSLLLGKGLSAAQERAIKETLAAHSASADLYVEHGYHSDDESLILQLVLFGLGAVLMLCGTLTATFLALSDARPDLATMAAVGARPRTRRAVAASYALVVALVGSVLGALVGAIPGWAVTYPLTNESWNGGSAGPYLDIPWLLIAAVVLGLPVLTAAIVGIFARSRLPLVARVE